MKKITETKLNIDLSEKIENLTGNQTVDQYEYKATLRSAMNIRTLLYEDKMLELIKAQTEESFQLNKKYSEDSNGDFNYGHLILNFKGIKVQDFLNTLKKLYSLNNTSGTEEQQQKFAHMFLFAHPEHYATDGGCVETMGGLPTFTKPTPMPIDHAPDFIKSLVDNSYPVGNAGEGPLKDGTPFTYVMQQYRDTDEGMEASLYIWYPAACPDSYVEEHVEHYAVEFRNGCKLALSAK